MTPETEKQIYESFRDTMGNVMNPIQEASNKMTDWPGGQAEAMRDIALACSPQTHRAALRRLCEKMEDLIDGRVSGVLKKALEPEIERLHGTLEKLRDASIAYAGFQEPYAGLGGTIRLAIETGTQPWNILTGLAGKHPYQVQRDDLVSRQLSAFADFMDTFIALMLAMESALSTHTGRHFSFREIYDTVIAPDGSKSES